MEHVLSTKSVSHQLKIGGLYQVNKNIWVMYASYSEAENASIATIDPKAFSAFSSILKGNIRYLKPNERFVALEDTNHIVKLLSEDGEVGYISVASERYLNNSISFVKVR
jgi:hypothetical protein